MPTYLRKYYLNKLIKIKKDEQKEIDKSKKSSGKIPRRKA
jgi:hypothetical protein